MKKALITGITGQDGSYLAEYLLSLGYRVTGLLRRDASLATNIIHLLDKIDLVYGDVRDELSIDVAIRKSEPDEIYNLAGQVFVPTSWRHPADTFDVNTGGLARILRILNEMQLQTKVYQASSSEMYGNANGRLNEFTVMHPVSPYGVSKLAAHQLARVHRDFGRYVCCGILFNHESPRRGSEMVTRKISMAVASWKAGDRTPLRLGNMTARRDWGFAGDYVKAMYKMLQMPLADDYVIGTGTSHSVYDFFHEALRAAGIDWNDVRGLLQHDETLLRKNELHSLTADANKANQTLKWQPETSFQQLVKLMVDADYKRISQTLSVTA